MVCGNCLRHLVFCAVLFGASAQQQRDGGAEAMTAFDVDLSVIVRVGNECRRASPEGRFGRAFTDDCPRRQPTPL